MAILMHGSWHLKVAIAIHNWENRWLVQGAEGGNGTYPPTVGFELDVEGLPDWELVGEYRESDTDSWKPSAMKVLSTLVDGAEIHQVMGSEDPLPVEDFRDIQWEADFTGKMIEIPYRPYAVRPSDLIQMPDGIFESSLGSFYMGVRVTNTWGLPLPVNAVLDISAAGRADLASTGIVFSDQWSWDELARLGQSQLGTGMRIGGLAPGESQTVFFKIDVTAASPRKHAVEFVVVDMDGTSDPQNSKRLRTKNIFVSKCYLDEGTNEMVAEVAEGTIRVKLKEVWYSRQGMKDARVKKSKGRDHRRRAETLKKMREALKRLQHDESFDVCGFYNQLMCWCRCDDSGRGDGDDGRPGNDRYCFDPFYAIPSKYKLSVYPAPPYGGQFGPIPYNDPWWKVLFAILAVILLIAAMLEEAADIAYNAPNLVIGKLNRWRADDVDAAVTMLDTDRALGFMKVLDARSDEEFQNPINVLDGSITLNGPIMTKAEVKTLVAAFPITDVERKVFKSGARSGTTHGRISHVAIAGHTEVNFTIEQLIVVQDPDFGNEPVSQAGDSGSVWVHSETLRPIALNHSGDEADEGIRGTGSFLEDVFDSSTGLDLKLS